MTTMFAKTLGPYAFKSQIATVEEELTIREQTVTIAGKGGRFVGDSLFDGLILTLTGMVLATDIPGGNPDDDGTSIRAAYDLVKGALMRSGVLPLSIDSDRYANVRLGGSVKASAWGGLPDKEYSVILVSREDPPWFSETATALGPFNGSGAVPTVGNGPADPAITLNVTAAPPGGLLTVADTTGQRFTIAPTQAGPYIVDSYLETVTAGGADRMATFDGDFLRLLAGANNLTLTASGGAAATWSIAWKDRWY